jgi:hypothetical protein
MKNLIINIINKKYKLVPFNSKVNYVGNKKYSPSDAKEWKNKIYYFNNSSIKNIPIYNININNIIKSYFSLYSNSIVFSKKFSSLWKRRISLNTVYISKIETQHTNSKVSITIYLFNRERKIFSKKIFNLMKFIKRGTNNNLIFNDFFLKKNNITNIAYKFKNILDNKINNLPKISKLLVYIYINNKYKKDIKSFYFNFIYIFIKKFLRKQLLYFRRYRLKYNFYKHKLEDVFLYKLSQIINRFYNKKIEFNIINLQSILLNSDTVTQFVKLKLKRKKKIAMKVIKSIINKVKIIEENESFIKKSLKNEINFSLLENKYFNLNVSSIIKKNKLDSFLKTYYKNFYLYKNFIINKKDFLVFYYKFIKELKIKYLIRKIKYNTNFLKKKIIFNIIKHKNFNGIKLLAKGRLTKRYRADRAIYKVRWIGGLKNRDASLKKISNINFRGYLNSNIEYSINTGKRRIGAFAIKGWISSK